MSSTLRALATVWPRRKAQRARVVVANTSGQQPFGRGGDVDADRVGVGRRTARAHAHARARQRVPSLYLFLSLSPCYCHETTNALSARARGRSGRDITRLRRTYREREDANVSAHANVRFATAMAEAVAAAAPGEPGEPTPDAQYAAFVTSTLRHLERGMRLDNTTKKQRVSTTFQNAELLIEDSKKSAARRVVEGRFALGGDDASYLQSGLSTLWTTAAGVGEEELDYDGDDKKTREEEYGSMKDEALAPVGLYAPDAIEGIRDGLIRAMKRRGQTILRDAPKSLAVVASAVRVLAKVPGVEEVLLLSDGEDEPTLPTMPTSWTRSTAAAAAAAAAARKTCSDDWKPGTGGRRTMRGWSLF